MKKRKKILKCIIVVLLMLAVITGAYLGTYYRAGSAAANSMRTYTVEVKELSSGLVAFVPDEITAGLIFYPGGKVEYTAYAPLMEECAKRGILCILVKMPGNLAVLDVNAAEGLKDYYPEVTEWYMGGHSLGGAIAANYVSKHTDEFEGLILLAAYSTKDLSESGLKVLCAYGTEDQIMNRDNYEKYTLNLPEDYSTLLINGGNHCQFGDYGFQKGDGMANISAGEQRSQTADEIEFLVNRK